MKKVNVHEAKSNFSGLLTALEKDGIPIIICRNGKPVADLVLHRLASRTKVHPVLSQIRLSYDPIEPLASNEWPKNSR